MSYTWNADKNIYKLRIVHANPLGEELHIQLGNGEIFSTLNRTILDLLAEMGMTPEVLEKRIPKVGWEYLGTYMGVELGLDTQGRFQLGPFPDEPEVIEVEKDISCQHGFVVRDVQGPNRFLCKECDSRFPSYPQKDKFKPQLSIIDANQEALLLKNAMDVYQAGFLGRMNQQDCMWAKGGVSPPFSMQALPLSNRVTESIQFIGGEDE